jgi:hypothetical protein
MKANGGDLKTIQELLRHATFKVVAVPTSPFSEGDLERKIRSLSP